MQAHEQTTGPEIWWHLYFHGLRPDAFVAGVGTGGTIMGVAKFMRRHNPEIKLHPLQPAESPTLTTGHKVGFHRMQRISDEFIPAILDLDQLDLVVTTVFPDDNKKYLSTDLLREERVRTDYLSQDVELISYEAMKRVCYTCFDGDE